MKTVLLLALCLLLASPAYPADNYATRSEVLLDRLVAAPRGWPVRGMVTSEFGMRYSPFPPHDREWHTGIDIANIPFMPVQATAPGTVAHAGWRFNYGILVVVDHGHGYSTYYGHLTATKVARGAKVERGTIVGLLGDTGRTTGPHLHYEVRIRGTPVNPRWYIQ